MMATKLPKHKATVAFNGKRADIEYANLYQLKAEVARVKAEQKNDDDMLRCKAIIDPIVDEAMSKLFGGGS